MSKPKRSGTLEACTLFGAGFAARAARRAGSQARPQTCCFGVCVLTRRPGGQAAGPGAPPGSRALVKQDWTAKGLAAQRMGRALLLALLPEKRHAPDRR